jgi:hypothetical protein
MIMPAMLWPQDHDQPWQRLTRRPQAGPLAESEQSQARRREIVTVTVRVTAFMRQSGNPVTVTGPVCPADRPRAAGAAPHPGPPGPSGPGAAGPSRTPTVQPQ